ncbi:MAG TPA: putative sulfate/molybdate transporter [Steroidobacteraceae bacterium]|jgi:MFS superfamily sulfate permease-like transporter|nr:putative sulfate/molybdate transporter [Steroidobacteraceae bacterium]
MEWAGAFGDLGTLVPFVVAYIVVLKMDPFGILFAFGTAMLACGAYYKTPFPVQPMKALGAAAVTQAAQTAIITSATVYGAGLVTGLMWLALGFSGAAARIAKIVPRFVVVGIVLGLGLSFMTEGIKLMSTGWVIAAIGLGGTLILLTNRTLPAMFVLLLFGAVCGVILDPAAAHALGGVRPELRVPHFAWATISWHDLWVGTLFLALPQLPLTLGNAVIAIREENNRLFPTHPVSDRSVAISTGIMNVAGSCVGGVPMCHGAGGMAGHVAFGARTGGAPIILGTILLALAFCFSGSIATILAIFPKAVLGVILFLTGAQLALGSCDFSKNKVERFITLTTAAFAMWNVGLAFIIGMTLGYVAKRDLLRL